MRYSTGGCYEDGGFFFNSVLRTRRYRVCVCVCVCDKRAVPRRELRTALENRRECGILRCVLLASGEAIGGGGGVRPHRERSYTRSSTGPSRRRSSAAIVAVGRRDAFTPHAQTPFDRTRCVINSGGGGGGGARTLLRPAERRRGGGGGGNGRSGTF